MKTLFFLVKTSNLLQGTELLMAMSVVGEVIGRRQLGCVMEVIDGDDKAVLVQIDESPVRDVEFRLC